MCMSKDIENYLLVLNIKAEPKETTYTFQTQRAYYPKYKKMLPRFKMLKYYKNKCINQVLMFGDAQIIKYISEEMKLYN